MCSRESSRETRRNEARRRPHPPGLPGRSASLAFQWRKAMTTTIWQQLLDDQFPAAFSVPRQVEEMAVVRRELLLAIAGEETFPKFLARIGPLRSVSPRSTPPQAKES